MNDLIEKRLQQCFKRAFRRTIKSENIKVQDIEEWDSLSHIKLIMELEYEFNIDIDPDIIAELYSDFQTIVGFLDKGGD